MDSSYQDNIGGANFANMQLLRVSKELDSYFVLLIFTANIFGLFY